MHPTEGLCMVSFNRNRADLLDDLISKFPDDPIQEGPADAAEILRLTRDHQATYKKPFYLKGTPFQCRVWSEICKVPSGKQITYGHLAVMADQPRSVRAVARACGANNLALVVPCHRVVGLETMGSYRWGNPIKAFLIGMEYSHDRSSGSPFSGELIPADEWDRKVAEMEAGT